MTTTERDVARKRTLRTHLGFGFREAALALQRHGRQNSGARLRNAFIDAARALALGPQSRIGGISEVDRIEERFRLRRGAERLRQSRKRRHREAATGAVRPILPFLAQKPLLRTSTVRRLMAGGV